MLDPAEAKESIRTSGLASLELAEGVSRLQLVPECWRVRHLYALCHLGFSLDSTALKWKVFVRCKHVGPELLELMLLSEVG